MLGEIFFVLRSRETQLRHASLINTPTTVLSPFKPGRLLSAVRAVCNNYIISGENAPTMYSKSHLMRDQNTEAEGLGVVPTRRLACLTGGE